MFGLGNKLNNFNKFIRQSNNSQFNGVYIKSKRSRRRRRGGEIERPFVWIDRAITIKIIQLIVCHYFHFDSMDNFSWFFRSEKRQKNTQLNIQKVRHFSLFSGGGKSSSSHRQQPQRAKIIIEPVPCRFFVALISSTDKQTHTCAHKMIINWDICPFKLQKIIVAGHSVCNQQRLGLFCTTI